MTWVEINVMCVCTQFSFPMQQADVEFIHEVSSEKWDKNWSGPKTRLKPFQWRKKMEIKFISLISGPEMHELSLTSSFLQPVNYFYFCVTGYLYLCGDTCLCFVLAPCSAVQPTLAVWVLTSVVKNCTEKGLAFERIWQRLGPTKVSLWCAFLHQLLAVALSQATAK